MLKTVGNKHRRIKNNLFPIKAKTLIHLDFKWNVKRKNPLLLLWVAPSRPT